MEIDKLYVTAIFTTVDGEANGFWGGGQVSTFLRLAGCNIRCSWCDTPHALQIGSGKQMTVDEVYTELKDSRKISITGGEPLVQSEALTDLVFRLSQGRSVADGGPPQISIETNGTFVPGFDLLHPNTSIIMDYKLQGSFYEDGMAGLEPFQRLRKQDVLKFVITDDEDYGRAKELIRGELGHRHIGSKGCIARKVFSPVILLRDELSNDYTWATKLAEKIIEDRLWDVQYSLQIHKVLWPASKTER